MKHCKKFTLMTLLWLAMSPAYAALVPTTQFTAEPERAQLSINIAQRQQVELELIELGVDPAEASERVSQMTDQQISSLQGKIAELPAGAAVSTIELLLIILLVILLL
jgi:TolA-binding protein